MGIAKDSQEKLYEKCVEMMDSNNNDQVWNKYDGSLCTSLTKAQQASVTTNYADVTLLKDNNHEVFFVKYTLPFDYPHHYHEQPETYIHLKGSMDIQLKFQNTYKEDFKLEKLFDRCDIKSNYRHAMYIPR